MATEPTETHMGRLLRAYGVTTAFSIRKASRMTGLSKETLARHLRKVEEGDPPPRLLRKPNLVKLAEGLGIPVDMVEDAMMADINYARSVRPSSITAVLGEIAQLGPDELMELQVEIAKMQRSRSNVGGPRRVRPAGVRRDGQGSLEDVGSALLDC